MISPLKRHQCSRTLFFEPLCQEMNYSLIYHIQSQTCLCREINNKKYNCFNNGLLIINDDDDHSTICSSVFFKRIFLLNSEFIFRCSLPFTGNQCERNLCQNRCQNNGTCTMNETNIICK